MKTQTTNTYSDIGGKLPPQAVEVEETVLGACIAGYNEKEATAFLVNVLPSENVFYKPAHQTIFKAIVTLTNNRQPVDMLTVMQQLKSTGELEGVGGAYYLSQLSGKPSAVYSVDFLSRILLQKWLAREHIRMCMEGLRNAYDDTVDVFDLYDGHIAEMMSVQDSAISNSKRTAVTIAETARESVRQYGIRAEKSGQLIGLDTGLRDLNDITNGWQAPDLIILAARPAMGKTAAVIGFAESAARTTGKAVAVFSLEMSSIQLTNRTLVKESGVDSEDFKRGTLGNGEIQELMNAADRVAALNIIIDDSPAISLQQFARAARRMKKESDICMIIVDYLQLMKADVGRNGNREQEVSAISRGLKAVAKELNVPVIALSQCSRKCEERADKRPLLSDLRESGAIEQDADVIAFIHRPEYYKIMTYEDGESTEGRAEFIIAKHRNGSTGTVFCRFIKSQTKFADLQDHPFTANPNAGLKPNTSFYEKTNEDEPF